MVRQQSWARRYFHEQEYTIGVESFLICKLCQRLAPEVEDSEQAMKQSGCIKYGWADTGKSPASLIRHLVCLHGLTWRRRVDQRHDDIGLEGAQAEAVQLHRQEDARITADFVKHCIQGLP